jgi:hypothetical protein
MTIKNFFLTYGNKITLVCCGLSVLSNLVSHNLDAVGGWSVATLAWVLIYFLDKTINTYEKLLNTTAREQVKPQSLG